MLGLSIIGLHAQMITETDTLYGNEWINHNQTYLKIEVAKDGIYRVDGQTLSNAGVSISSIQGSEYQVFHLGKEIPLRASTNSIFSNTDFLEFFGEQNRAVLDSFLFENPSEDLLNPYYSLFTDTAAYYLTWQSGINGLRFQNVANNLTNLPTPDEYFMYDKVNEYNSTFIKKRGSGYIYNSSFEVEGFAISSAATRTENLDADYIYANGSSSTFTIQLGVVEDGQHNMKISVNGTDYVDEVFNGYVLKKYNFSYPTASLQASNQVAHQNSYDSKDKASFAYIRLNYPREFNFDNQDYFDFYIDSSLTSRYLEIDNFNHGGNNPILLDLTNQIYIQATYDNSDGKVKILLPPSNEKRHLILYNTSTAPQSSTLLPTNFIDFSQLSGNYLILSNSRLYNDPATGTNWVQEYANYRSSSQGGGYNVLLVDIFDLYEQFSYGVKRTPLSIRNFAHYLQENNQTPEYLFIIGKALEHKFVRTNSAYATYYDIFFVPTYGFIGADNMLTASLGESIPLFALGRLAAITPNEVKVYLDKIKEYENVQTLSQSLEDKAWMKRIAHLGGGDPTIQNSIKNSLKNMENIIENNQYGATVETFLKTSSDPIQISQTERLTQTINDGVSIMTFFGHSYAGGFDISLDDPGFYENQGKYPLFLSYGCYSGRIHASLRGLSEGFVLEPNKGAIAFMSSNGLATVSGLDAFGKALYNLIGGDLYNQGVGKVMRQANLATEFSTGNIVRQMTLHGDPAIKLNAHPGPDYLIDASSVNFTPSTIDIQEDNFLLDFDVVNIGAHMMADSFIILKISQELPSGELFDIMIDTIKTPAFRQNFQYELPTLGEISLGLNTFHIQIDADQQITELPAPAAEMNNSLVDNNGRLGVSVFFSSSNVNPVFPTNFGVVGTQNVIFKATPSNVFADTKTYIFEIDTSQTFSSPFKQRIPITQAGGVLKWQPNVTYENEKVYYWRVSPDSISLEGYNWKNSSFVYLNNENDGWNQSHYYQYQSDDYFNMRLNSNNRKIEFIDDFKDVIIRNIVNSNPLRKMEVNIGNTLIDTWRNNPMNGGDIIICVLDSFDLSHWENPSGGIHGAINNHGSRAFNFFPFSTDTESDRQLIIDFLNNIVPAQNYVIFLTSQLSNTASYLPELWAADSTNLGTNLFQVLEQQGATKIRQTINNPVPYIFMYQKDISPLGEVIADTITEEITLVEPIAGSWDEGYVESVQIGPASSWERLLWNASSDNNPQNDIYSVDVIGVKSNGVDTIILNQVSVLDTVLNFIDADNFPYLKLRFNSLDTSLHTSAHLDYWRILYQGLPELAIVPNKHFEFYNDTLQQGEILDFQIAVENISPYPTDSVLVQYTITDVNNNQTISNQRLKTLNSGDTLHANLFFDTEQLKQLNTLTFEVNPNLDQEEMFTFNNTAIKSFYINQDKRHPLLDVTFDGIHIMDGDVTSPTPQILISLKDENPYLALNDTSLFKVWIVDPEGNQRRYFNDGQTMVFYPADDNQVSINNQARIEMTPNLLTDGVYQLIVQAQDRTGNSSGSIDYKVSFEVVTASSISYVLNYPNPFTTSTQFVFTLTGTRVPDDLRIQIYTVSGRLIREITKEELGNIRIGQNRSDFRWDGTDQFGDRLANGVYLYRVIATIDGEELDNFYTKASPYFHNGFGKMVLMR